MKGPIHPAQLVAGKKYISKLFGGPFLKPLILNRGEFVRYNVIENKEDQVIKVGFKTPRGDIFMFPWIPEREEFFEEEA